jgi:hypothetical protein
VTILPLLCERLHARRKENRVKVIRAHPVITMVATNLFVVSPAVATAGDLTLPVLATAAKWILIGAVLIGMRRTTGGAGGRPRSRHGRGI